MSAESQNTYSSTSRSPSHLAVVEKLTSKDLPVPGITVPSGRASSPLSVRVPAADRLPATHYVRDHIGVVGGIHRAFLPPGPRESQTLSDNLHQTLSSALGIFDQAHSLEADQ